MKELYSTLKRYKSFSNSYVSFKDLCIQEEIFLAQSSDFYVRNQEDEDNNISQGNVMEATVLDSI